MCQKYGAKKYQLDYAITEDDRQMMLFIKDINSRTIKAVCLVSKY
jgi:hypothetical protein